MAPALSSVKSDYDAVKALVFKALVVIRSDHFDDYFDLFTTDAIWMMPSSNKDVSLEEAKGFYGFTRNFWFDQETDIEELTVVDDMAFVRVSFDGYLRSKKNSSVAPLRSVSRHIWILRRQSDNNWLITRDIWNNPKTTNVGQSQSSSQTSSQTSGQARFPSQARSPKES